MPTNITTPIMSPGTSQRGGGDNDPIDGSGGGWNGDAQRLLRHARELAKQRQHTLDGSFEQRFLHLIEARNPAEDSIHPEYEALRNTETLMQQMMDTQEARELTGKMLNIVLQSLCPLWLFCR